MVNSTKKTLTRGAAICLALSAGAVTNANAAVTRLGGQPNGTRYTTSDAVVKAGWADTFDTAILASGEEANKVDALTVAPLATKLDAPVVLVDPAASVDSIVAKFVALNVSTVYIANGDKVIKDDVLKALEAKDIHVTRLGGLNRYQTALNIAKALDSTSDSIVVTNGETGLADALSIASIAAAKGMPIFLTDGTSFGPGEDGAKAKSYIDGLSVEKTYILGGPTLVTETLAKSLPGADRVFGNDRYETNADVLAKFADDADVSTESVFVAGGENTNLIDSLSAAPFAGKTGAPIIFADPATGLSAAATAYLTKVVNDKTEINVLGGTGAVSAAVEAKVTAIQKAAVPVVPPTTTTPAALSVSATNATTVKVTFNQPVAADKTSFAVSNGVQVTGVSINGSVATLTTTELPANATLTLTYPGIKGLEKNSDAFRYNVSLSNETAIEGLVRMHPLKADGTEDTTKWIAAVGVTVNAGTYATKTDAYGYYKIPVAAGKVTVTPVFSGYFQNDEDSVVVANKSTTQNMDLVKINSSLLEISGIVKDSATGIAVQDATAKLQQFVNNEWVDVASCKTGTTAGTKVPGSYSFLNKTAVAPVESTVDYASTQLIDVYGNRANQITLDGKFRVTVSKDLSATNLNDVYKANTADVTVNLKGINTITPVALTAVKAVNNIYATATWNPNVTTVGSAAATDLYAKVELIAVDGKTVLATALPGTAALADLTKDATTGMYSDKINVASLIAAAQATGTKQLQLPTGTYYLRITDNAGTGTSVASSTATNAIAILPVSITEGTDFAGAVDIKKAVALTADTAFSSFPSSVPATAGTYTAGAWTTAKLNVYKTINNVDVLVTSDAGYTFVATGTPTPITAIKASGTLKNLAAESYKVAVDSAYTQVAPSAVVTLDGTAVNSRTLSVDPAGVLGLELALRDATDTGALSLTNSTTTTFKIVLKDANGNAVKTYTEPVVVSNAGVLSSSTGNLDATSTASNLVFKFGKLPAGKYTAYVTADNFKDNNGVEKEVKMLLDYNSASNSVKMIAQPNVVVKGSLQLTTGTNAQATKIVVFNASGTKLTLGTDYTINVASSGSYQVNLATAGTYKLVVYGLGTFETQEKTVTLVKGDNTVNWTVNKGGEAQTVINLYDEKGTALKDADVKVTLLDKYGEDFGEALVGANFAVDGKFVSATKLSAGAYTLTVDDTTVDKYTLFTDTITLGTVNGTDYSTKTVKLNQNGITFKVSGLVAAKAVAGTPAASFAGYVVAFDKDGKIVQKVDVSSTTPGTTDLYTLNLSNGSYTVAAYVDGDFVGSKSVVVKDLDQTNVDFTTTEASR